MLLDILQGSGQPPPTLHLPRNFPAKSVNRAKLEKTWDRQVIVWDLEGQVQSIVLYHENKGNPLKECKKTCDVIMFGTLESISGCS